MYGPRYPSSSADDDGFPAPGGLGFANPVAEQRRLGAVHRYHVLDTPRNGEFDHVARLAVRAFNVPIATVTIVDEDRIWFRSTQGLTLHDTERAPGLCASAILRDEPYVVNDALQDAVAVTNPLVRGELGLRFYAAAPITTPDGFRLGTVNVLDTEPRQVTDAERETLVDLADVVMHQLDLRMATMRIVRAERDKRRVVETNLNAALESRADIDQAIGMIMLARQCDAAAAWDALSGSSQRTNLKLRDLSSAMRVVMTHDDPHAHLPGRVYEVALRLLFPTGDSAVRTMTGVQGHTFS